MFRTFQFMFWSISAVNVNLNEIGLYMYLTCRNWISRVMSLTEICEFDDLWISTLNILIDHSIPCGQQTVILSAFGIEHCIYSLFAARIGWKWSNKYMIYTAEHYWSSNTISDWLMPWNVNLLNQLGYGVAWLTILHSQIYTWDFFSYTLTGWFNKYLIDSIWPISR